jgi:dTDP-4-dehydrorhamnose 3,5-epimerase-like enzyme
VHIEDNVEVEAGAVICAGVHVGAGARIGAGCVINENVPPNMVLGTHGAHVIGYSGQEVGRVAPLRSVNLDSFRGDRMDLAVGGAQLWRLREYRDYRGALCVAELHRGELPFPPARIFLVYDVPGENSRGDHAHHRCEQFLHCVRGQVSVVVDDGRSRAEVRLASPSVGVYIPALVWGTQYRYSTDAVLSVYASRPYEADDYIRNYSAFLQLALQDK